MLRVVKGASGDFSAEVLKDDGEVIVSMPLIGDKESDALDFFSTLAAALDKGFRTEIIKEGY
jgi:hypothetical protein